MPLTEQEKQEIMARRQSSQPMAQPTQAPNALPPELQAIASQIGRGQQNVSIPLVGGGRLTQSSGKSPQDELLQKIAEKQIDRMYQAPTESERASTRIANIALQNTARIKELLKVSGTLEKPVVKNRNPITLTMVNPTDQTAFRPPWASPDAKQLRDDLENSFALLALLRTGKAGETRQISNIRGTRNIGQSEQYDPKTIFRRIDDMEKELKGFAAGDLKSPLDSTSKPNDQELYIAEARRRGLIK